MARHPGWHTAKAEPSKMRRIPFHRSWLLLCTISALAGAQTARPPETGSADDPSDAPSDDSRPTAQTPGAGEDAEEVADDDTDREGVDDQPPAEATPAVPAKPAQRPEELPWATEPAGAPPLGQPPPPPEALAPEHSRRMVELVPHGGLAFAHCRAGDTSSNTCEGVGTGAAAGFMALWRVTGRLAWGGGLDFVWLRYNPPDRLGLSKASAGAAFLGVIGRFYAFDEGPLDPYVQLALGGAAVGTQATDSTNTTYEQTGAGPALQVGVGFDFFLGTKLRLGPAASATHVLVDKIRRCQAGGQGVCDDVSRSEHGYLDTLLRIDLRVTFMLGPET